MIGRAQLYDDRLYTESRLARDFMLVRFHRFFGIRWSPAAWYIRVTFAFDDLMIAFGKALLPNLAAAAKAVNAFGQTCDEAARKLRGTLRRRA